MKIFKRKPIFSNSRALREEDYELIKRVSEAVDNVGFRPMSAKRAAAIIARRNRVESIRERDSKQK